MSKSIPNNLVNQVVQNVTKNTVEYVNNGSKQVDFGEADGRGVTDVSVTNENGIYSIKVTNDDGTEHEYEIDEPDVANLLAEINDSIVENNTAGYDFHTFKETENNGTQNDVSKFYISQNQITSITLDEANNTLVINKVDQSGLESQQEIVLPKA